MIIVIVLVAFAGYLWLRRRNDKSQSQNLVGPLTGYDLYLMERERNKNDG